MKMAPKEASAEGQKVRIYLECGATFEGKGFGDFQKSTQGGEFVFCTAMSGVEESLTDPSFAKQVLVSTVSHVGNTGANYDDSEASKIWAEGLICRHLSEIPSNWRSQVSLKDWIVNEGRFVVEGIDTRGLTTLLREEGSQRGVILPITPESEKNWKTILQSSVPSMKGLDLTDDVSVTQSYVFDGHSKSLSGDKKPFWPFLKKHLAAPKSQGRVCVWDFGVKTNTLRILETMGFEVYVMPARSKAEDFVALSPKAILLSNGPGDPAAATHIITELKKLMGRLPIFSICLGHQLVGHAVGGKTYKMKFGHRGIHHPVVQLAADGTPIRTWITSQNHGFAVDADSLPSNTRVSFVHADDKSVEGLSIPDLRCETVQFHPEAAPGPFEGAELIVDFFAPFQNGQSQKELER